MAIFVPRFVRQLRDVLLTAPADGEVLTYDSADEKWKNEAGGGGGGPTGAAGGVLGGTYPNPDFDVDMATQAELDAHVTDITDAHDATAVSVAPFGTIAATQVQAALEEIVAEAVSDLGPAVILAPASSARNVIQPTAGDVIAAIVKAHAAQSVDLTQWQLSNGTVLARIDKDGQVTITPNADGFGFSVEQRINASFPYVNRAINVVDSGGLDYVSLFHTEQGAAREGLIFVTRREAGVFRGAVGIGGVSLSVETADALGNSTGYTLFDGQGSIGLWGSTANGVPILEAYDDYDGSNRIFYISSTGVIEMPEQADPAAPAANLGKLYIRDNGSGITQFCVRFATGGILVLAEQGGTDLATHLSDASDAHDATAISFTPDGSIAATTVQAAIVEVRDEASGGGIAATLYDANTILKADTDDTPVALTMGASTILARLAAGNIKAATPAELTTLLAIAASGVSFSPTGTIAATDVQAAIAEVASEAGGGGGVAQGRLKVGGVSQHSIPGVTPSGTVTTFTCSANRAQYFPIDVRSSIVIDQIVFELTTGVVASTCRLCIYPADVDWQPGTMVANTDTGTLLIAAANVGVIATTITDTTLAAGRYLIWLNVLTGNPQMRSMPTDVGPLIGYPVALGTSSYFSQIYTAQTYGAPPSSGLAIASTAVATTASFQIPIFLRVKTP